MANKDMTHPIAQQGRWEGLKEKAGEAGLATIAALAIGYGGFNAVDEVFDYGLAPYRGACTAPGGTNVPECRAFIDAERDDARVEGLGSIVIGGGIGTLSLFMRHAIREERLRNEDE